jgi:O-acetyl-ADP-ribose deacetylase (regulator of RNase III)
MTYKEEHRDLFSVNFKEWTPAHCISLDCKMGAGIAVPMRKKFKLGGLKKVVDNALYSRAGFCVHHNGVYNLITKKNYWNKPTYENLKDSIISMMFHSSDYNIKKIAMPKIGCGLDRLSWLKVREIIKEVFKDTDIEILVCVQ